MNRILKRKTYQLSLILIVASFIFQLGCASNSSTQIEPTALQENDSVSVNENELSDEDSSLLGDTAMGALAGAGAGLYGCSYVAFAAGAPFGPIGIGMAAVSVLYVAPICLTVGGITGAVAGVVEHNISDNGNSADEDVVNNETAEQTFPSYQSTRVDSLESLDNPITNTRIVNNSDPCSIWGMSSGGSQEKCV